MSNNKEIDPIKEGGLFNFIHGLVGYFIATAILVILLIGLTCWSITVQKENATKYYSINQDIMNGLKANSPDNYKMRIMENK